MSLSAWAQEAGARRELHAVPESKRAVGRLESSISKRIKTKRSKRLKRPSRRRLLGSSRNRFSELESLPKLIPGFALVNINDKTRSRTLRLQDAYIVEDLRGVPIDPTPPVLSMPDPPYTQNTDYFEPLDQPFSPAAPYVAREILPFDFDYLNVIASHTSGEYLRLRDYLSSSGFTVVKDQDGQLPSHLPAATDSYSIRGSYWDRLGNSPGHFERMGLPIGRYDLLNDIDPEDYILPTTRQIYGAHTSTYLSIDQEESSMKLNLSALIAADFFPSAAPIDVQMKFVERYYRGIVLAHQWNIQGARESRDQSLGERRGLIEIYGPAAFPFQRTWFNLDNIDPNPRDDFAWNAYGSKIYEQLDVVVESLYPPYGQGDNPQRATAYALANLDFAERFIEDAEHNLRLGQKPVNAYLAPVYHGGGGGERWWRNLVITRAEAISMITSVFFAGADIATLWGWGPYASMHQAQLNHGNYAVVKRSFPLSTYSGREEQEDNLQPGDVIFVAADNHDGSVDINIVDKQLNGNGLPNDPEVYRVNKASLAEHIRVTSEVNADYVEGLALIRPIEKCLKLGNVKIDFPANRAWASKEPIVRRVQCGNYHVLLTFDPKIAHGALSVPYREMTLAIGGHALDVQADGEPRIYVVKGSS